MRKKKVRRSAEEIKGQLLLAYDELKVLGISYSRPHLTRLIKAKRFPQPVALGENRVAFVRDELIGWINDRIAARDAA
jgi:prophage regulatory protein